MESIQQAESDSEDRDSSLSEDMDSLESRFDCKKWTAFAQMCLGVLLVVLEIANIAVLNPSYRLFCPGIWIGAIFITTGGLSLGYYRLEHMQNKRISIVGSPPMVSHSRVFRIAFLLFLGISLALCVAMIVVLAIAMDALRQELLSPNDSRFSMPIAMTVIYVLMIVATVIGLLFVLRYKSPEAKSMPMKSEIALVQNDAAVLPV